MMNLVRQPKIWLTRGQHGIKKLLGLSFLFFFVKGLVWLGLIAFAVLNV